MLAPARLLRLSRFLPAALAVALAPLPAPAQGAPTVDVAFRIADPFFVPEGIAYDPRTRTFFVGSTFRGKIVRVDARGRVSDLIGPNEPELFGVVGMRVDTARGILWAASGHAGSAMPLAGARQADEGRSSLFGIDLRTGRVVRRVVTPPGERHFYNDVAIGARGEVFFTDSYAKELLVLEPGGTAPRRLLPDTLPKSPNGIDVTRDGRHLVVALEDRIGVVDLGARTLRVLDPLPLVRSAGSDGLYALGNGVLTVEPWDHTGGVVKRYYLDADLTRIDSVRVALYRHPDVEQPTTAAIVGDTAFVVANSHLQTFRRTFAAGDTALARDSVRGPVILRVPLGGALQPARVREMGVIPLTRANEVAIVDGASLELLARVPTLAHPQDVVPAADGRTVYVLEAGTDSVPGRTVAVLDARARKIVRRMTLEECTRPHWGQLSSDGRSLWVACAPQGTVVELDLGTERVRRTWRSADTSTWMFVVPRSEDRVYMANFEPGTLTIAHRDGRPSKTFRVGGRPVGIAATPDGREVWVSSMGTDTLRIFDAERDSLLLSMPSGGEGPVRIEFTPDGSRALITQSRTGAVDIVDTRTHRRLARVEVAGFPKGVLVRPDGRIAYVSAMGAGQLTAVDVLQGRALRTIPLGAPPERMAWLPAGAP